MFEPVGEGDFTVDSDRASIGTFMVQLVRNHAVQLLRTDRLHTYRMLMCTQRTIFSGLPPTSTQTSRGSGTYPVNITTSKPETGSVEEFLLLLKWPDTNNTYFDEAGFAALHYAAVAGDVDVLQGLLDGNADVNLGTALSRSGVPSSR